MRGPATSRSKGMKVDGDLPFADDSDVLEVDTLSLFSKDDVSAWADSPLPVETSELRVQKAQFIKPRIMEDKPIVMPPPLRRRMRYYIRRPFDAEVAVSVAPAARSTTRFTERTAISDASAQTRTRWLEVISTCAAVGLGIWMILSM